MGKPGRFEPPVSASSPGRRPSPEAHPIRDQPQPLSPAPGRIDVLVNNAGGPVFNASVLELRDEGWQRLVDLNLTSVFRFCRAAGRAMVARERGSVVNAASVVANRPWPALAAYTAAKAGVLSFTQVLALEWGAAGVRANAITPGWVMTDINRRFLQAERDARIALDSVPMARLGETDDMSAPPSGSPRTPPRTSPAPTWPSTGALPSGSPRDWRALRLREGRDPPPG